MAATLRPNGTRKRPASAMSPPDDDQVREIQTNTRNSNPPQTTDSPARMSMQAMPSSSQPLPDYVEPNSNFSVGLYGSPYYNGTQHQQAPGLFGNELVRAQMSNQIVPMPNNQDGYPMAMPEFGAPLPPLENGYQTNGQPDDLDHRAMVAQKDSQGKRKQIPPFVQKLSSFLDENTRNTDLIRWSDSGDSFIVVDEDEFAKTLIPELFKHNNYASFVRQLNMYGFHKKVGLSDNSMRASERKNKNPSEYSNPYFKRGRPNLLWLIHKPKNPPSKFSGKGNARAKPDDAEEDADDYYPRDSPAPQGQESHEDEQGVWSRRQPLMLGPTENKLPPEQVKNLHQEMAEIRRNQNKITEMLQMTRRENAQLYNQAKAFHELHEKHDNSINAILTFLASVYQKSMHDKNLDFGTMFGPNTLPSKDAAHDIIDVGDEKQNSNTTQPRFKKKQPLLLKDKASPGGATDTSANVNQWPASTFSYPTKKPPPFRSPAIHEIHDQTPSNRSSESPRNEPEKTAYNQVPEQDILSLIQNQNAQNNHMNGTHMEFPEALSHLQNTDGQSPLTPHQRQSVLRLMSDEQAKSPQNSQNTNALTSYSPPNPAANLAQFSTNADQLNQLERSLRDQEARMANMQATIAPLSPSGSIPGMNDGSYQSNPELDLDSIFNSGDYFNDGTDPNNFDFTNGADLPDFDFSSTMEPTNGDNQAHTLAPFDGLDEGRVKEMDSSEATSPANTIHTIDDDQASTMDKSPKRKLRKRGAGDKRGAYR